MCKVGGYVVNVARRVMLVSVPLKGSCKIEAQHSLTELSQLARTLGHDVLEKTIVQYRNASDMLHPLGRGKLVEMTEAVESEDCDLVVVDMELTPRQLVTIEEEAGCEVTDRTGIILDIFHKRASSKEAKLEVELARIKVLAPRLRYAAINGSGGEKRDGKGTGETDVSEQKRRIRDRTCEIKGELADIFEEQQRRRDTRRDSLRAAIVGYTNAGKSSWMRRLTHAPSILVEDKLFATLDTTVRPLLPAVTPPILMSDTVGFIQRLPHDLVASFKSTLDEARDSALLVHVVDASDGNCHAQIDVTRKVLAEIGAWDKETKSLLLLNKADLCSDESRLELQQIYPSALLVSSKSDSDVELVHALIVASFDEPLTFLDIHVPYRCAAIIKEVHTNAKVLYEEHDEHGIKYQLKVTQADAERFQGIVQAHRDREDPRGQGKSQGKYKTQYDKTTR
ncbi:GTP-binding protein HflX [Pelagophyceae sp. CCMP2097]|nr:GTP-binding protein HflX [Pelagophyceae sp. CCMP2097]|mmetsp:Transcript_2394/g.8685  ORF Transcript_2394/g.8685 Transcript_2394/m.8685 type:complete len:452 (-) Transcript_2394:8-1363(-)